MARAPEQRLVTTVGQIVDFHNRLNNAEWVLSHKIPQISRILMRYKKGLRVAFGGFLQSPSLEQDLNGSIDTFFERMKRFITSGKLKERTINRAAMLAQTKDELLKQFSGVSDGMVNRQLQKVRSFKVNKSLAEIKESQLAQISKKINTVRIEGETFDKKQLDNVWEALQNKYGDNGQVIFDSGQKRSLRAYVDGRTRTTANDLHRSGTVLTAAATGIFFGRVSSHSATDSCILHEGELVFMTQALKDRFIAQNPDLAGRVSGFHTVQDLEADSTHMFGFDCKHIVLAEGVQFFGKEAMKKNFDENVVNRLGNLKLSEAAIERNVKAGNIEAGFDLTKENIDLVIAEKFRKPKVKVVKLAIESTDSVEQIVRDAAKYDNTLAKPVKFAIKDYSTRDFRDINARLAGRELIVKDPKDVDRTIKRIDTYLKGAPKFSGDVYRGMSFDSTEQLTDFVETLKKKKLFSSKTYLSSSSDAAQGYRFGSGQVVMKIRAKDASSIEGISVNPQEKEFLFPRDSRFRVTDIRKEKGTFVVEMEEL